MKHFVSTATEQLSCEFHAMILEKEHPPKHFHKNNEIIIVAKGGCACAINGKKHKISAGEGIFVCPFQLHELAPQKDSLVWRLSFNNNIVLTVAQSILGRVPKNPKFKIGKNTLDFSLNLLSDNFGSDSTPLEKITPYETRIKIKGMLYLILADFLSSTSLISAPKTDAIATEIALYISNNYKNNISLKDIAQEKGYNYQYLSRTFNKHMDMNFKTILNYHRAQRAYAMLQDTDLPVSYIGLECGFQSIRSFNQVCRNIFGKTPKEIRNLRCI